MEPKGSLPHLQEPTTYPYSEPDQSSPFSPPPPHFPENPILYSHLCLGFARMLH